MEHSSNTLSWILLTQFLLFLIQTNAKVPAVIVFGDSTVDSGNNNFLSTILRSNFMPYGRDFEGGKPTGRFSNGRIPTDFLSEAFGCKPTVPPYLDTSYSIEDFATGVCFASAGTGYDNATASVLTVMPLWKELECFKEYQTRLEEYIGVEKAKETIHEAVYLLSVGTNDFLENYYLSSEYGGRASQFTITQYEDFLASAAEKFLRDLYSLGARKISLGGIPPMGCLPLERARNTFSGTGCIEQYNKVAIDFNVKLEDVIAKLNKELDGIDVVLSSTYEILHEIIKKPSQYGFENVAVACCATGIFEMGYMCNEFNPLTCTDANKYVFWDAFHPTEKTNRIVADHIFKTYLSKFA